MIDPPCGGEPKPYDDETLGEMLRLCAECLKYLDNVGELDTSRSITRKLLKSSDS